MNRRRMAMSRRLLNTMRRPHAPCDHKFVDSPHYLKCGWMPPPLITSRPLSDAEATEALEHAFARARRRTCLTCGQDFDLVSQSLACPHLASSLSDPGRPR